MKNFVFYQKCVADTFWLPNEEFIKVDCYESAFDAYRVYFDTADGTQFFCIDLEDIKVIVRCLRARFGVKSHSFKEWNTLLKDVRSLSLDTLLRRYS